MHSRRTSFGRCRSRNALWPSEARGAGGPARSAVWRTLARPARAGPPRGVAPDPAAPPNRARAHSRGRLAPLTPRRSLLVAHSSPCAPRSAPLLVAPPSLVDAPAAVISLQFTPISTEDACAEMTYEING
ncbi:unnamed protein product [Euphydryas editha]|uniref:Uncharacterized protein n=1 Tax=Euphydryas editha TaxID=104508 RepID=A0AAU9U9L9_EUPED|nr:unnamed protein product [Euphydryas editha]